MPPTPPGPSQQVERIREILIGRQMRSVEHRLDRLEDRLRPMPVEGADGAWVRDLESLRHECRASNLRLLDALDAERLRRQEETQRLAQRIETVARHRRELADEVRRSVEARLRPGFEQWQHQLFGRLEQRESDLVTQLREELERMRVWVREELSSAESGGLHQAFGQLAAAAREIADSLPPRPPDAPPSLP